MNKQLVIKWLEASELVGQLSTQEYEWLFNDHSLTQRLTELSHNQFSVEVLREQWQSLRMDEYMALQADTSQQGWVREVLLKGGGEPWVYARSVAMQTGLNNPQCDLTTMGNKPLGSVLFMDEHFKRTPLEVAYYPKVLLPEVYQDVSLWGRRSNFINEDLNVLVQEVFLPAFWQRI